jgi:internalin A
MNMSRPIPENAFAEAERRIAHAKATRAKKLQLNSLGLRRLPESIAQLPQLTHLDLSSNKLSSLPESIGQLTRLTELFVLGNRLTSLPESIGQLTRLKLVLLQNNQLMSLPESIGQLKSLTLLFFNHNELTLLPESLGHLTQVTHLFLGHNRLTSVPEPIAQLESLEFLDLTDNQLTSLPDLTLGRLTRLIQLDLSKNDLATLPQSLRAMKSLRYLYLHDNPRLHLPRSVLGKSLEERRNAQDIPRARVILDYYFRTRLDKERRPLREAKLILVGRGEVGKTSLVRRLVENKFSRREDRTQGIRITHWPLTINRGEVISMHVWDFGGQEIMHATHQFFLTDRSVYLLVLDGRAGQQEVEADYWLRLISSFAPESPVLVVLNKIQKDPFDLNRRALQEKFPQVQGFIETDCDNPTAKSQSVAKGLGIDDLRKAIVRVTNHLPDLRAPFPSSWFEIKEALSKTKKNYLAFDEYRALCAKLGETDEDAQGSLAAHLHRLGIALNFREDRRLRETHVLNPHWVTEGIYALLNSSRLATRKGELRLADLKTELDPKQYPKKMHQFVIDLMEKFELCFSFPKGDRYLIPELLDEQQPKAAEKFDPATCLNFQYHYPVIPAGLLPRFIVRTHVLSGKYRWRTGVILAFEGNTALVKADLQDRKIFISISGPTREGRRRMLAMIREDFDSIHRDIQHLDPAEMVPLPSHPAVVVPYHKLEVMEREDPDAILHEVVGNEVVKAQVRDLLNGIDIGPRVTEQSSVVQANAVSVFYSYAHADAKARLRLDKHLAPLRRLGLIVDWYDNDILPGDAWSEEIATRLNSADMVLLLVSPDFMSSEYCQEIELAAAMKKEKDDETVVLPIIIRRTNAWAKLPIGKLKALPAGGKPIQNWKPQDDGWADVAAGIERAAEVLRERGKGSSGSRRS